MMLLASAPMTVGKSLSYYTGIFSTAVTASVNPTATMATLSVLGAIENAADYSPDSAFFTTIADALNGIPVISTAADLPIANPYAAVFLTLVAAIMIVLHSFAESKIVSQATIDKIDKFTGWIGVTALSIMPMLTTEAIEKTHRASKHASAVALSMAASSSSSSAAPWYVWVIGIITLIIASVVYFCCYSCVDNIGTICAAIPVKGLNIIEQIIKAIIHAGMILLQLTFPVLSFIISIILAILGILLFRVLARITFYYKEVYIRPVLHLLFRKNKPIAKIHKKLPRKIRKKFPEATLTVPVFIIKGIKKIPSRSVMWYVDDGKAHLIIKKTGRKLREIDTAELKEQFPAACLVTYKRFHELHTPDKKLDLIIGKSYTEYVGLIAKEIGFPYKEAEKNTDTADESLTALSGNP